MYVHKTYVPIELCKYLVYNGCIYEEVTLCIGSLKNIRMKL